MNRQEGSTHRISVMPDEQTLRGIISSALGRPTIVFRIGEGVFERVREPSQEELSIEVREVPTKEILEAFLNGEAVFNRDTGKLELR